jgi:hypothetical protein
VIEQWKRVHPPVVVLLLVLAISVAVARVGLLTEAAGVRLSATWVMADFFSGVYYPVRAFLDGHNPHDRVWFLAHYPLDDGYPPYLPIYLLILLPLGWLSPSAAAIVYFVVNLVLVAMLAHLGLRLAGLRTNPWLTALLTALILLSRPGHWTLILGQRAAELAVASYAALYFARRSPLLGAAGLTLALIKPTYGIPLALLMVAAGYGRVVGLGVLLGALVNLPLFGVLAAREGGVRSFLETLIAGYRAWQQVGDVNPATSNVRVDAATTVSRFLGHALPDSLQLALTLLILGVAAAVLYRLRGNHQAQPGPTATGIICLAVVLTTHHVGYDLLLLTAPLMALVIGGSPVPVGRTAVRWVLIGLYAVPALNWLSTQSVLGALQPPPPVWLVLTSVNGVCIAILFVVYLWYGWRRADADPAVATSLPRWAAEGMSPQ